MKELTSLAINYGATLEEPSGSRAVLHPSAEVCLHLSEPVLELSNDGSMARVRKIETIRFAATPASLRKIAQKLEDYAEELDRLFTNATATPRPPEPAGNSDDV